MNFAWSTAFKIAWREARSSAFKFAFVIVAVAVGVGSISRLDEGLARHFLHGPQHGLIADPASPQG